MLEKLKYEGYKFKIDSRKLEKGDVFLCLKGEKTDGHNYIDDALSKGASYIIVDKKINDFSNEKIIKVDNVLTEMLSSSSKIINQKSKIKIGITGSTGKTTTKEFLFYLLLPFFKTFRNELNMNTEIGIPLCILNDYNDEEIVILEEGLQKIGDLEFLSNYFNYDVAIITNVGSSHLKYLNTIETVAKEKMKITNKMEKGLLIINGDYPILKDLAPPQLNILTFGKNKNNDAVLESYEYNENFTTTVYAKLFDEDTMFTFNGYWGEGQILDLLSCLLFLRYLELVIDPYYLSKIMLPQDRFQVVKKENLTIINDSYNASYESFKNAFESIKKMNIFPKTIIMGEIKELGNYSEEYHKKVIEEASRTFDKIYFYDPHKQFSYLNDPKLEFFEDLSNIDKFIQNSKGLLYIKASNATGINKYIKERGLF
jgi:UDP-N-acetylmuramoyl-tripeptide--D-alanyl-D-alanine ligase